MKVIRLVGGMAFILGLFTVVFIGIPWYLYHDPMLPWWLKTAVYLMMGGILVVLISVAVEHKEVMAPAEQSLPGKHRTQILLQNAEEVPGRRIVENLGLVKGHTIYAVSLGKDLSALLRLIPGGELVEYTEMMGRAREIATQRMVQEAEVLGADAIINIRFVTTSVVTSASELLAYGTAVKFNNPAA